ncbi:hypothetical protein [Celeribacter arenosi]|uniref:VPLPA-CTERM protein sorting domain-containing protein n=1 Tax=Celeribacter arenosi TaxID=792649 RepID=A0ABP7K5Q1_9RHOB
MRFLIFRLFLTFLLLTQTSLAHAATVRVEVGTYVNYESSGINGETYFDLDGNGSTDIYFSAGIDGYQDDINYAQDGGVWVMGRDGLMLAKGGPLSMGAVISHDNIAPYFFSSTLRHYGYRKSDDPLSPYYEGVAVHSGDWGTGSPGVVAGFLPFMFGDGRLGWMELETDTYGHTLVIAYGYATSPTENIRAGAPSMNYATVPLPASGLMLLSALAGLRRLARRRRRHLNRAGIASIRPQSA